MKILFQGDSITDAGRMREGGDTHRKLGCGYPQLIGARLMCDNPDITVENRGVSGNRISDMYGRWIEDTLNIDFDILSILCGVNDIGFGLRMNMGADAEKFRFIYDRMVAEAKNARPESKIVLCEPFILKLEREQVPGNEDIIDNWELWHGEMLVRRKIVKELADKHNAVFVPFGEMFDRVCKEGPAARWSFDGIHATSAGHELMARKWIECVMK
ncbi:MAG: SGNH/GDSL hydrolase family protein [Clostridia bacterium]|nr:SGNH/GDSL hydrolase family protein [Clostridia bacterium]